MPKDLKNGFERRVVDLVKDSESDAYLYVAIGKFRRGILDQRSPFPASLLASVHPIFEGLADDPVALSQFVSRFNWAVRVEDGEPFLFHRDLSFDVGTLRSEASHRYRRLDSLPMKSKANLGKAKVRATRRATKFRNSRVSQPPVLPKAVDGRHDVFTWTSPFDVTAEVRRYVLNPYFASGPELTTKEARMLSALSDCPSTFIDARKRSGLYSPLATEVLAKLICLGRVMDVGFGAINRSARWKKVCRKALEVLHNRKEINPEVLAGFAYLNDVAEAEWVIRFLIIRGLAEGTADPFRARQASTMSKSRGKPRPWAAKPSNTLTSAKAAPNSRSVLSNQGEIVRWPSPILRATDKREFRTWNCSSDVELGDLPCIAEDVLTVALGSKQAITIDAVIRILGIPPERALIGANILIERGILFEIVQAGKNREEANAWERQCRAVLEYSDQFDPDEIGDTVRRVGSSVADRAGWHAVRYLMQRGLLRRGTVVGVSGSYSDASLMDWLPLEFMSDRELEIFASLKEPLTTAEVCRRIGMSRHLASLNLERLVSKSILESFEEHGGRRQYRRARGFAIPELQQSHRPG